MCCTGMRANVNSNWHQAYWYNVSPLWVKLICLFPNTLCIPGNTLPATWLLCATALLIHTHTPPLSGFTTAGVSIFTSNTYFWAMFDLFFFRDELVILNYWKWNSYWLVFPLSVGVFSEYPVLLSRRLGPNPGPMCAVCVCVQGDIAVESQSS